MKKIFGFLIFTLMVMVSLGLATAFAQAPNVINFNVPIKSEVSARGIISVNMGAVVLANPNNSTNGSTVLVLNGTGQTSITFQPFANAVFSSGIGNISRFVLLNFPGHANSSLPISTSGANFGDLTLSDYVTSLIESIKVLDNVGMSPDFVIGHSLGAEVIQLAQDRLITQGTSLRTQFGIKGAFFIVSDIVGPLPWAFADSGNGAGAVRTFTVDDPQKGLIVRLPPPVWLQFFYGDLKGRLVGAPTEEDAAQHFITDDSAQMAAEFLSASERPTVQAGIFANSRGTICGLVALEQDGLSTKEEQAALYKYLTISRLEETRPVSRFFFLTGPTTVHNQHTFDPKPLVELFGQVFTNAN